MDNEEYYNILDSSNRKVRECRISTSRFLLNKIDWRDRLIQISGSRGTGKTTLLLQHIKSAFKENTDEALYVSLDNLWFETHSLTELADIHYKNGGTHLFIDEVHYLKNWQLIIKNLYDDYPKLNIVYTGSSILKIDADSGDLSRRQVSYSLPGLSFREYLCFENIANVNPLELKELLRSHKETAESITTGRAILKHFNEYLTGGYYPFYKEIYT
ncbi:MAG: AAA family ATPase, partial [Spirochaetaceae bacterium]|nr:AAA family ATPase [Spirochaetaceae bacterium]